MPPSNRPTEEALEETAAIEQVLEGDCEAYTLLVRRYNGSLFRYLLRMLGQPDDAEDVAQEAFLRAYLSLASYDSHYRFSTWLFRIATNLALNWLKDKRRIISLEALRDRPQGPPVEPADTRDDSRPYRQVERAELARLIRECLEDLSPAYRMVVSLRHFADLSYEEISICADIPLNTVRSRLHRGRERLGECLEERLPGEECP